MSVACRLRSLRGRGRGQLAVEGDLQAEKSRLGRAEGWGRRRDLGAVAAAHVVDSQRNRYFGPYGLA